MLKTLKKYSLLGIITFSIFFSFLVGSIFKTEVFAQATCSYVGQCVNNKVCIPVQGYEDTFIPGSEDCGSAIIGGVGAPEAVSNINIKSRIYGGDVGGAIGILFFLSKLIKFGSIVAGIIVMLNFISAGFVHISSAGDSGAQTKVRDKLTWSIVGILVIVSAYTIAGLIGLIFFGDATFLLNPTLEGAV